MLCGAEAGQRLQCFFLNVCVLLLPNLDSKGECLGASLVVQWLGFHAPSAGGLGSIPGQETSSHMPQLRPGAVNNFS